MSSQSRNPVFLPNRSEPLPSNGCPSVGPFSLPTEPPSGATSLRRKITSSRGGRKKQKNVPRAAQGGSGRYRRVSTISKLPDDVLLEIFDFCRKNHDDALLLPWPWHVLVHVCQRWRQIVFASPHRLDLRILCRNGTPVRESLSIWPAFPIVIDYGKPNTPGGITPNDRGNAVAALKHSDRVCFLQLNGRGSQLEKMTTVMQRPFPVLTRLIISSVDGIAPILSTKFLGGSALCLQKIYLDGISHPTLPKLLLTAKDLVKLYLSNIPPTGYISPEAMAACLVALPRLENLIINFQMATPRPNRIHPPPLTRTVLPALTSFVFQGASEYLEGLVSRIDGPQVNQIYIHYLNQLVDFQITQFSRFINRSVCPEFTLFKHAHVIFSRKWVNFVTRRHASHLYYDNEPAEIRVSCQGIDWQVSHMAQLIGQFRATLSNIVSLRIWFDGTGELESMDDVEWLHLLRHFSTVQTLYISVQLAGHIALAMEDITAGMVAEVLPSLTLIHLENRPASSVEKFVAVRQLSGRPVTVVPTYAEFQKRRESICK